MTPNGHREEILNNVFQIPNKSRITRKDAREDKTFLSSGDEKKWCGTFSYPPEGKCDSTATQMVKRFLNRVIQHSRASVLFVVEF